MRNRILLILAAVLLTAAAMAECEHSWGDYAPASSGSHTKVCALCGQTAMDSHNLITVRESATCTEPARVTYVCTLCGYETEPYYDGEPSGNHVWGSTEVIKEPTCTEEGVEERVCGLCGATDTITLDKTDHTYGKWTGNDDYWHVRKCTVCGNSEKERHDSSVARTVTYAQDARLGKKSITCADCGYMFTRFYSAQNSKLYNSEKQDVAGYFTVDTISVKAGSTATINVYPDGVIKLTANTNTEYSIYANADTLEYKGLSIDKGDAMLTIENSPVILEFMTCADNASLQIDVGSGVLIADNTNIRHAANGNAIVNTLDGENAEMHVYKAKTVRLRGSEVSCQWESVLDCRWSYDATVGRFSFSLDQNGYIVEVHSGDATLFTGSNSKSYEKTISSSQLAEGWYVAVKGSVSGTVYASPMFDWDGSLMSLDTSVAEDEETAPAVEETAAAEEEEPEEAVPEYISADSSFEVSIRIFPDITVTVENGVYAVKVARLTEGTKVDHISFVQNSANGMRLSNVYAGEASFVIDAGTTRVNAFVYITDASGKTVKYAAGSFECAI